MDFCFKMHHHLFAAFKEHKAWHVWVLRDVRKNKAVQSEHLGLFTMWRKTSVTTLLWSWSLSPLCEPAPSSGPDLLFFVCFSLWLD